MTDRLRAAADRVVSAQEARLSREPRERGRTRGRAGARPLVPPPVCDTADRLAYVRRASALAPDKWARAQLTRSP